MLHKQWDFMLLCIFHDLNLLRDVLKVNLNREVGKITASMLCFSCRPNFSRLGYASLFVCLCVVCVLFVFEHITVDQQEL